MRNRRTFVLATQIHTAEATRCVGIFLSLNLRTVSMRPLCPPPIAITREIYSDNEVFADCT